MVTVSLDATTSLWVFVLVTGADSAEEALAAAESTYSLSGEVRDYDEFYEGYTIALERN